MLAVASTRPDMQPINLADQSTVSRRRRKRSPSGPSDDPSPTSDDLVRRHRALDDDHRAAFDPSMIERNIPRKNIHFFALKTRTVEQALQAREQALWIVRIKKPFAVSASFILCKHRVDFRLRGQLKLRRAVASGHSCGHAQFISKHLNRAAQIQRRIFRNWSARTRAFGRRVLPRL